MVSPSPLSYRLHLTLARLNKEVKVILRVDQKLTQLRVMRGQSMKTKRIISVVLLSLLASIFQSMPVANAAAPGAPSHTTVNCDVYENIYRFTMTGSGVTGFKLAFVYYELDTVPGASDYYVYNGISSVSGSTYSLTLKFSDYAAAGIPGGRIVRPWIKGVSGADEGTATASFANCAPPLDPDDNIAPTLSSVSASSVTSSGATLNFTSNESGNYYYLVYPATQAAPTAATVVAQGTASAKGTSSATAAAMTASITGLVAGTSYKAYLVAKDSMGNSSTVSTVDINTIVATPDLTSASDLGASGTDNVTSDSTPTFTVSNYVSNSAVLTAAKAGSTSVSCTITSNTCTLAVLADGTWSISVTDTNTAGNTTTSSALSITVDTAAPSATLTSASITSSGNASVTSSEIGTAYLVQSSVTVTSLTSITSAADSSWNSVSISATNTATNLSASGLSPGDYVLYTADAAGNLSAVASNTVTVSMGAPSTPDLNSSSDLGTSSTDNQTADDTPTIDLTGLTTGAVVTVTATPSSGSPVTCTFTATSGSGSCTFSPALVNGTYAFKASQTLSGVTSSDSSNLSSVVIYKTTLTPTVTLDLNTLDDLGSSSTDNITSATTLRVTSSSGGISYTYSSGSGSSSGCTSGCSFGTFSSGVITFRGAQESDSYGNTVTPTLEVTVNTGAPTLSSVSASSVAGTTANLNFTSNQAGTYFYLVLAAAATAPDAATIIAQGTSVTKGSSSASASTNTVAISGLSESTAYKTYLVVRHAAGGISAVSNVAMTTTIAVPSVPDLAAASDLGSSSTDNSTSDNTPTVDLSGLTSGASVTVTATPSTGSPVTCTFTATGSTGSCTFSALTNGTYSVKVKQTVGGVDSADSVSLTGLVINSQSIATPATPDLTSGSDLGNSATDNVTSDDTPTISVAGTFTGTAVVTATKAGSSDVTCTIVSGSCTLGSLADGTWSLTVTDSTSAGSTATSSSLSITVDTGRPTVALTTANIFASGNASVQSNELGTAYLVRNSVTVSDLTSITSQAGDLWNTVSIATVNTATNLPATGLAAGTYLLYTVDVAGNLSLVSTQTVLG